MTTRKQLCRVLQAATGLDDFLIWRTADTLGEAGVIPPSEKSEVLPVDAAVLLCAVTAARSPGEAVDAVEAQRRVVLEYAGFIEGNTETPMTAAEYVELSAGRDFGDLANAVEWFEFMLKPHAPYPTIINVTMSAGIGRGVDNPLSVVMPSLTLDIDGPTICALRLVYRKPSLPMLPVCSMTMIEPGVFAHLARLFATSSYLTEGAALGAVSVN